MTDEALAEARSRAEAARSLLRDVERADAGREGWEGEYLAASTAARVAERRVEALEQLRAAQLERAGQRDKAVGAAQPDLKAAAAELAASRDRVAAAAGEHLKALAALAAAAGAHNQLLAGSRAKVAGHGLRVADDLLPGGAEHAEGTLDGLGLRAGGTDWTVIPAAGVVAHALRQVYGQESVLHPLSGVGKYVWRAHEVQARPDGLRVPALEVAPAAPARPRVTRATVADILGPPPGEAPVNANPSGYEPGPARRRSRVVGA